ncbi:MAG: hypothetical protein JXQ73_24980 [Phycisphaerae bacterium]|nr:hypothetical protein [Phycisphaerae bacterium]
MVEFTKLANVSEKMIENLLERVDRTTFATALQGANARLIDRVLGKRSPEQIERVLEDIQEHQVSDLAEIREAQRKVAEITEELEAAGIPVWAPLDPR